MTEAALPPSLDRRLLQLGLVLFLLGLLTGLVVPAAANPRMALSSHLEGVQNGILLLVLGAIWGRLHLSVRAQRVAGTPAQEALIRFGLASLSVAMVAVSAMALWGPRRAE